MPPKGKTHTIASLNAELRRVREMVEQQAEDIRRREETAQQQTQLLNQLVEHLNEI